MKTAIITEAFETGLSAGAGRGYDSTPRLTPRPAPNTSDLRPSFPAFTKIMHHAQNLIF